MKLELVIPVLTAIALLTSIANTIWLWLSKGGARQAAELDKHTSKLTEHDRRIQAVEGELKHVPSKEDISELRLEVARMAGKQDASNAELESVARTVRRIEDHLLGEKS